MSYRKDKILSLAGANTATDTGELKNLYAQHLNGGLHGLCFSPYEEGQKPGDQLSASQIQKRLEVIQPYSSWVRSFSCTEGNELIPKLAKEMGMKTMAGAWLGSDAEINRNEIDGLVEIVNQGLVDVAAVGNEVLYRGDLGESELLDFIKEVKARVNNDTPIGYVDAYYEFRDHPVISDACDVILANCYPFWEGCDIDYSLVYMKDMYAQAVRAGRGKKVIISETGWPDTGSDLQGAHPSTHNAMKFFINAQQWAKEDGIEMFYFSSFDESWKIDAEGDVGAYWGIWDRNEKLKFVD